jgi:hypothetical protein
LIPLLFALHVVFMNYALLAPPLVAALWTVGRTSRSHGGRPHLVELATACAGAWPVAISFTITTGVAVLLFVQVMYGHFFYAANILLGWRWLLVVVYLPLGFYGVYVLRRCVRGERWTRGMLVLAGIAVLFMLIALEFTNNSVLMLVPSAWADVRSGTAPPRSSHAMWLPRLLHTLVGALAVSGIWLAAIGRFARTRSPEARRAGVRIGLRIALVASVIQALVGVWFFLGLDASSQRALYDPRSLHAWLWMLAIGAAIGVIALLWRAVTAEAEHRCFWPIALTLGGVLVGMAAGREAIRLEMLGRVPGGLYSAADVRLQIGPLLVFLVAFAGGLAILFVMLRWAWMAPPPRVCEPTELSN